MHELASSGVACAVRNAPLDPLLRTRENLELAEFDLLPEPAVFMAP